MQIAVEWLESRLPVVEYDDGRYVRWLAPNGHVQEARVDFVAERYGAQIEQAQRTGQDVVELVIATGPDAGWHDIWRRWRELGFI